MFGPSLLVAPVYTYKAGKRNVYFPLQTDGTISIPGLSERRSEY